MDLLEEYKSKLIRTYKIQAVDEEGNLIKEKELAIKQNDILVLQFDPSWSEEMVQNMMETVAEVIREEDTILAIPSDVQLKVISINE